jgi:transcriptional regulator with XRE-family HTH domain
MEKRNVGGLIKELRRATGENQGLIAERLHIERSSISKIESGIPALSQEVIKKIASIFSINPDFIDGRTDNAFVPESFLKLKIRHYVDILGGSSMVLPFLIMLNTEKISIVFLLEKFKVRYLLAKDELNSIFVMEIVFNLKLDEALANILSSAYIAKKKITMRASFISDALFEKLRDIDVLRKDDVIHYFDRKQSEISDLEKMLVDLVRGKSAIKDIILFLKGMGLK